VGRVEADLGDVLIDRANVAIERADGHTTSRWS
jgi:hypothetical protein